MLSPKSPWSGKLKSNGNGKLKKILLTGAGGFVGHHTLAHLLKTTDYSIVVTDSFNHKGNTARLRSVFEELPDAKNRVKVITHDLRVPIDSITGREIGDVEIIISMASESHVDRSISSPRKFISNNIELILTLAEFARSLNNLELFLQISTDEVYGPAPDKILHKEWDPYFPSNPYSASKASQESICFAYWRTFNLPIVITNTMNIIGERQDKEKFVPKVIGAILSQSSIDIHGVKTLSGWKSGSRFYLHARNQADALRFIVENRDNLVKKYSVEHLLPSKFHIVGEKEISNDLMVELISKIIGRNVNIKYSDFHSSRPGHDLRYALDGSKLNSKGWNPPISFEKSLEKTVLWYLRNLEWLDS